MAGLIERLVAPAVVTRSLTASPDAVWQVISDPTTYPDWLVGAKRIRGVDPDWPHPGAQFEHEVGAGPVTVHDSTEVTVDRPGRELGLIARARPLFEADVRFDLGHDGGGTLVRMSERPRGSFVVMTPLTRSLVRARNARSLRRLAAHLDRSGVASAAAPPAP